VKPRVTFPIKPSPVRAGLDLLPVVCLGLSGLGMICGIVFPGLQPGLSHPGLSAPSKVSICPLLDFDFFRGHSQLLTLNPNGSRTFYAAIESGNGGDVEMDRQRIAHGHMDACEQPAHWRKSNRTHKTNRTKLVSKVRSDPFTLRGCQCTHQSRNNADENHTHTSFVGSPHRMSGK